MWALYASNTGFCVEFDVDKFPFIKHGPFPIHYCDEIDPLIVQNEDMHAPLLIQTNIKNHVWSYEHEWRLLIENPEGQDMRTKGCRWIEELDSNMPNMHDRKFYYPVEAVKSITLGYYFFRGVNIIEIGDAAQIRAESIYRKRLLNFIVRHKIPTCILVKDEHNALNHYLVSPIRLEKEGKIYKMILL